MTPNEEEQIAEKTRTNGETLTIAKTKGGYDVDCWDKDGNNRWHKFYWNDDYEKAKAEFDRWL